MSREGKVDAGTADGATASGRVGPSRRALGGILTLAIVFVLSVALWFFGFTGLGAIGLDLRAVWSQAGEGPQIVKIRFSEQDDSIYFGDGERPFDPGALEAAIRRAHAGGASAIGIDVTTEHPMFAMHEGLREVATWPEVVWAHGWRCAEPAGGGPRTTENGSAPRGAVARTCPPDGWVTRLPLGGVARDPLPTMGLARLELDPDLQLRRFRRSFRNVHGVERPTFATSVVSAASGSVPRQDGRSYWIRFRAPSSFIEYTLHQFMTTDLAGLTGEFGPLRGRVVLIGGAVRQDLWMTPLGYQSGLDAWAHIIATELAALESGERLKPVPGLGWLWTIETLAAVSMLLVVHLLIQLVRRRRRPEGPLPSADREWVVLAAALLLATCALGFAWVALGNAAFWYLAPLALAIVVIELHEELVVWVFTRERG